MSEDLKLNPGIAQVAKPGGVGFQVTVEVLFMPHPNFAALECDRETLRKEMADCFLEVLKDRIPASAEAQGYVVEDLRAGVQVLLMDALDEDEG